jgi:hypothetical protein
MGLLFTACAGLELAEGTLICLLYFPLFSSSTESNLDFIGDLFSAAATPYY